MSSLAFESYRVTARECVVTCS